MTVSISGFSAQPLSRLRPLTMHSFEMLIVVAISLIVVMTVITLAGPPLAACVAAPRVPDNPVARALDRRVEPPWQADRIPGTCRGGYRWQRTKAAEEQTLATLWALQGLPSELQVERLALATRPGPFGALRVFQITDQTGDLEHVWASPPHRAQLVASGYSLVDPGPLTAAPAGSPVAVGFQVPAGGSRVSVTTPLATAMDQHYAQDVDVVVVQHLRPGAADTFYLYQWEIDQGFYAAQRETFQQWIRDLEAERSAP